MNLFPKYLPIKTSRDKLPLMEKEMATHSSILAWKIPWTGQPGWLEPMELQSQTELRLTDFRVVASSICAVYSQSLSHV